MATTLHSVVVVKKKTIEQAGFHTGFFAGGGGGGGGESTRFQFIFLTTPTFSSLYNAILIYQLENSTWCAWCFR